MRRPPTWKPRFTLLISVFQNYLLTYFRFSEKMPLVVSRVVSGEYKNISFIHEIADQSVEDVTEDILAEAALPEISADSADLQAARFDHARDLRKHERA